MTESQELNNKRIRGLRKALRTSNRPVLDECEDWNIFGTKGKIYLDNTYWYLSTEGQVNNLKEKLSGFMKLWQGDFIYRSDKYPDAKQAAVVRKLVGLKQKRVLSPEHKAKAVRNLILFSKKDVAE
jgi:hypothetical protein